MLTKKTNNKLPLDQPLVRSDILPTFRNLIGTSDLLNKLFGPLVEFKIVLDANVLIFEAIWAAGRNDIDAKTALHEAILAGTIIPYATQDVIDEVLEHLPEKARERGKDPDRCFDEFQRIKTLLNIQQPSDQDVKKYIALHDPDDAPSLALSDIVNAIGIHTRDPHISKMGGIIIPQSFVFDIRDYSRHLAVELTIKVSGYYLSIGAFKLILAAYTLIQSGVSRLKKVPLEYRLMLVLAIAGIILHPRSRNIIIGMVRAALNIIPEGALGELIAAIIYFADEAEKHKFDPPVLSHKSWNKPNRRGAKLKFKNEVMAELIERLETTGLDKYSGSILYSGAETVSLGPLYLLGYNPGGDPLKIINNPISHLERLLEKKSGWSEYVDEDWSSDGRHFSRGRAPMQRRVRELVKGIDLDITKICASNLIFVRSQGVNRLTGREDLAERCWPVHELMLDKIRPQAILSVGGAAVFDFVCLKGQQLEDRTSFDSGHGNWKCYATKVLIGGAEMSLVSVPHLSRYAIDHHSNVIRWVRGKLLS